MIEVEDRGERDRFGEIVCCRWIYIWSLTQCHVKAMKAWRYFNLWTFWHQPFCENIWSETVIVIKITLKWLLLVGYSNSSRCAKLLKVPIWNLLQLRLLGVQGWILESRINPLAYNFLITLIHYYLTMVLLCCLVIFKSLNPFWMRL